MRYAVIDMGTNTFHLLIVERVEDGVWKQVVRHRVFVRLAEEGLRRIGKAAYKRGLDALKLFKTQIDATQVPNSRIVAYGTAALRSALNSEEFLAEGYKITGFPLRVISGEREADLIYKGVRRAVPFPDKNVLIIDIGGGSVEFILANRRKVLWQKSFDIGISLLFQYFHKSDPIDPEEILALEDFLDIALKDLWKAMRKHKPATLIGASGAFDTIDNFLLNLASKPPLYGWVRFEQFERMHDRFIASSLKERKEWPKLEPDRMEMIVVSLVLIRFVCLRGDINEIYTSEYAMKEGMLEELV